MAGYTGSVCPTCQKVFTDGDDVVVCPDCGTPHHRACYRESGSCANAARHSEGFVWQDERAQQHSGGSQEQQEDGQRGRPFRYAVCERCGTPNHEGRTQCELCGYPLENKAQQQRGSGSEQGGSFSDYVNEQRAQFSRQMGIDDPNREFVSGITVGDMADFIGPNHMTFLVKFRSLLTHGGLSFNLCAFFFSAFYCFYRKMYKIGAVALGVLVAMYGYTLYVYLPYVLDFMNTGVMATSGALYERVMVVSNIMRLVNITVSLLLGFFFNKLYLKHCIGGVKAVKDSSMGTQCSTGISGLAGGYRYCLARRGGVDRVAVVAVIALLFVLYMAAMYIFLSGYMPQ